MYKKFYHLESRCTRRLRQVLKNYGEDVAVVTLDSLAEAVALGDDHVRQDALRQLAETLKKQSWENASLTELETRLSPTLQVLSPKERLDLMNRVLGTAHDDVPNIGVVLEYAIEACSEYAQKLLDWRWEQVRSSTLDEDRLRILKKVYEHHAGFSDLGGYAYRKDFSNKVGIEYITLSVALMGDAQFVQALAELAKGGFAYGKVGESLFGSTDLQQHFESLSDADMLKVAAACKAGNAAGRIHEVLHNSFTVYVTQRVLEMYGVHGFAPPQQLGQFDTTRSFTEVFAGIGEHVMGYYSELMLEDCIKAYGKTKADVVTAELVQYYKPIPESAMRTGRSLTGVEFGRRSVDSYADVYNPADPPFYAKREYDSSSKREAIDEYLRGVDIIHDRNKSPIERMQLVTDLIPEKTDYRDTLLSDIEQDFLDEHNIKEQGHRLVAVTKLSNFPQLTESAYSFYTTALPLMVEQARMQLWGRRADALYKEYIAAGTPTLSGELTRIQQLFPVASFARDEALYAIGNTTLVQTPEQGRQIQNLLSEMQRQTHDSNDLKSQSQLERFNVFMGNLSRSEKRDFILWTIGAVNTPPKSLRAYGGLNRVSVEDVPAMVFAATPQEREQFLLRMFVGSNGLFEPQNPEDQQVVSEFIDQAFTQIFPDDAVAGLVGQPREILKTVFSTVLTEYDSYRSAKIFIGMLEALQSHKTGGRGEKIVTLMAELGPVFIKVGQVLSETETRSGEYLLPDDIRQPMKQLKQSAKRFHRLAAVFSLESAGEFNADAPQRIMAVGETLAAASIKQVNAVQRADGQEAVEKVLRPSIEKHLQEDVRVLGAIVESLRAITTVPHGIEQVGATYVQEESDFAREVANTQKIAKALDGYKKSAIVRKLKVQTTEVYSFSKTHIQEEKVRGISLEELTHLGQDDAAMTTIAAKHGLTEVEQGYYRKMAQDVASVRLQAFDALAFQYFQADAFHSDPHAGNLYITPDGVLKVIDNGSIGETNQRDRNNLKKFFLGFALDKPLELRAAVKAFAADLTDVQLDGIVAIAQSPLGEADKMNKILTVVTEQAKTLHPAFDKFLKSFATGAYLMIGLKPDDVRTILGAHTQGDSGSLRSYAATAVARAMRNNPTSLVGRAGRSMLGQ